MFAYTLAELSAHSETPEVQLSEILSTLIEAGTYEDFKAKDFGIFLDVFNKKFDVIKDRIVHMQNDVGQTKAKLEQIKGEKDDIQLELNTLREEMKQALDENANLTQINIELESLLPVFKETQLSEERLRGYLEQAQNQNADLRAALYSTQQSEKEAADYIRDYLEQISELKIELQSAKQIIL